MATGDNVLTAISVARQCKMLDAKKPVYLGEMTTVNDVKQIVWTMSAAYTSHDNNDVSS